MSTAPVSLSGGGVLAVVGVAAVAYLVWKGPAMLKSAGQAAADAASAAADAVNPLNDNNVFAQAANGVTSAVTGQPDTLGGAVRSATSNDDARIQAMLTGQTVPPAWSLWSPSTWLN